MVPANTFLTSIITVLGILFFCYFLLTPKADKKIFVLALSLVFSLLISAVYNDRYDRLYQNIFFVLINCGVASAIISGVLVSRPSLLIYYMLCLLFFIAMAFEYNPSELLRVASHNGISLLLVYSCVTYYLLFIIESRGDIGAIKLPMMPVIISLIIAIWAIGRGGILTFIIFLMGILLHNNRHRAKYIFSLSFATLIFGVLFFDELLNLLSNVDFFHNAIQLFLYRLNEDGSEYRFYIWTNYMNNLDVQRFFFGVNMYTDPWGDGEILAYNYHNMLINLHAYTGLFLLVFIFFIIKMVRTFYYKAPALLVVLVVLLTRGMTDQFLFFESFDYLLLALFILSFKARLVNRSATASSSPHALVRKGLKRC